MNRYLALLPYHIQQAEASGNLGFASALRAELAAELLKANQRHFFTFILAL